MAALLLLCGKWQLTTTYQNCYTVHELAISMAPVLTPLRREQTADNIESGEALLVALKLKVQRQIQLAAPNQDDEMVTLCRLILDIQAVEEELARERYRLSVCRR